MSERTELNARVGRLFYKALTDAEGYPNGMPYWAELSPGEKYFNAATGLGFLDYLVQEGLVTLNQDFGLRGDTLREDCDELMRHFEDSAEKEQAELEERVRGIQDAYPESGDDA
jgi:hypothetical protein